ncbi:hypothetical protein NQ318_012959 [Aromia moschata]|uniref:C-type lectin domain-containing protein n=1 Tax=Aromia moschata TaxID=1265417 RepID=A0AAV8XPU6_9CUCU|nr:hypothetical protein NQ318_012959 [Aromia moschata]
MSFMKNVKAYCMPLASLIKTNISDGLKDSTDPMLRDNFCQTESENGTVVDITPSLRLQKLGNTYYYFGSVFKGNYFQAIQFCNSHDMSLLSVESEEEGEFLLQHLRAFSEIIG